MAINPLKVPLVNDSGDIGLIKRNVLATPSPQTITNPLARQLSEENNALIATLLAQKEGLGNTPKSSVPKPNYANDPNLFPTDNFVNVTGYLRAKNFGDKSQETQREMLNSLYKDVNERFPGKFTEAQLAQPASRINGALFTVSNDKIKNSELPSGFWQGIGSTAAQAITGTVDAGAGLLNVLVPSTTSSQIAKSVHEFDKETREKTETPSRRNYVKRRDELLEQSRYAEAVAHMASNPTGLVEDAAILVLPSLGGGFLLRAGAKGGAKLLGKEVIEQTAKQRAKTLLRSQVAADASLGTGHTAQNTGEKSDYKLSGEQRAAVFGKGLVDAALSKFGYTYGINPENLLLRFGKAADLNGAKGILKSYFGSAAVDAASNMPSSGLDAALTMGFDKNGQFDANRVDWGKVTQAMASAGVYAPFTGGIPGALHAREQNANLARIARDDTVFNNATESKTQLAEAWPLADEAGRKEIAQQERALNASLEENLQARLAAMDATGARLFRKVKKEQQATERASLEERYRHLIDNNPIAEREQYGPTADDDAVILQKEFGNKPLDMHPAYLERYHKIFAVDNDPLYKRQNETASTTELMPPPLLLEDKGQRTTPLTRAEYDGSFIDWLKNRTPEERANTLYHLEQTDRIKRASEEALLERLRTEQDVERIKEWDDKLAQIRTERIAANTALQKMLAVMPVDDPALGLADHLRQEQAQIQDNVLRDIELATIARQKVTASELAKADSDKLARLAAEQTLLADAIDQQIAVMPETVNTIKAQKRVTQLRTNANEYLAQAYEKATGEKKSPSLELARFLPAYEQRLKEASRTARAAQLQEERSLRDRQDEVLAHLDAMRVPENLGPRESHSFNHLRRTEGRLQREEDAFINTDESLAQTEKRQLNQRKRKTLRSLADEQSTAAANNLMRQERRQNPLIAQTRSDATHTATTALSQRAQLFAETLRKEPNARDPLNVGALVNDRDTRLALPSVNDATGMVALLAERKAKAEGMTSGILYRNRAILNDILAAYETVHPKAYRAGMRLAEKVLKAEALGRSLPAGEIKVGSYLSQPNIDMLTRLKMGDILGALEAVKIDGHTSPIVQQLINMLKAARKTYPVNIELTAEPIVVRNAEVNATYDPVNATIYIRDQVADQPYYLVHEATHHALYQVLNDETRLLELSADQAKARSNLIMMYSEFAKKRNLPDGLQYAQRSIDEFISEAFSNPQLQAYLRTNPLATHAMPKFRRAFGSLVDAVRRFLNLKPKEFDNLSDIIGLTRLIVGADIMPVSGQLTGEFKNFGIASSKNFHSGILRIPLENSGDWQTIGRIDMLPSGRYKVTIDGEDMPFHEHIVDTANEASEWAADNYGARVGDVSENPTAPLVGEIRQADLYGQAFVDMNNKVLDSIGKRNAVAQAVAKEVTTRLSSLWSYFWATNVDVFSPAKAIDRIADRLGYRGTDGKPLNLYEKLTEGMAGARAVTGRPGADLNRVEQGIIDGLHAIGIPYNVFHDYAYAQRAIEMDQIKKEMVLMGVPTRIHENPTAFHWTDNKGKVHSGLEGAYEFLSTVPEEKQAQIESILKPMRDINQMLLDEERKSGLISTESYYRMKQAYHYVPLLSTGEKRPSIHKTFQGRYTKAADPVANMLYQMQTRYANVARNNALRALYEMVNSIGMADLFKLETHKLERDDAGNVIAVANQKWNDKNGVWVFLGDKKAKIVVDTQTRFGKDLLRAIQKPEMMPLLTMLRTTTGYMASNMTTYSPSFLLKVPVWNTVLTLLNFSGAFDRNMSANDHFRLATRSLVDVVRLLPEIVRDQASMKTDNPMRKLFAKAGGGNNAGAYYGLDAVSRRLNAGTATGPIDIIQQQGMKGLGSAALNMHHRFVRAVHASDEVFRYSAFLNFLEDRSGRDLRNMTQKELDAWAANNQGLITQAAKGSRELAGNFTRHGSGKVLPAFFAFWNAGMQSLPLVASIMSTQAGRFGLMGLSILAAAATQSALDDPDDEDTDGGSKFARSPSRKKSICFGDVCGEMPYEVRPFMIAMQNLILLGHGKIDMGEATGSIIRSAAETFMPVQPAGDMDSYTVTRMMIPTAAQPLITIGMGTNEFGQEVDNKYPVDWAGKQITNPANVERGKTTTPEFLKDMTRFFYEKSNGMVDISPARTDALLSSLFSGVYNMVRNTTTPPLKPVGWGDNAILQTATSAYRYKTNDYAVTQKYRELITQASASGRLNNLSDDGSYNVLMKNDPVAKIENQRAKAMRNLHIEGMTLSQLNGALDKAFYDGDEVAIAHYQELMRQYYDQSSLIYGNALIQLQDIVNEH
ncbi:LPD38 domain-containing protein [Xenorhabdus innexi]|uniref:Large polyvalent protein associated domain-containing protein n=1 Tax=Xenorhabdus innexi TaxID=290109 RepID=A0A1N6MWR8_9GAMM|nr:LPD38 domain-containing protein [Xenorhabdus innexi]PHM35915.1 hypothetical protein Xinn_01985 [Xenorhabdus innexi]SIP73214.1 hypothetical protein XIS1_1790020 [Xenorhabdus innexi]